MSMLCIPGQPGKDLCDRHLGVTRRDLLRVGGSAMLGLTLGGMLQLQARQANERHGGGGPGWGKAKSVILVYLQGGPSHLDLWDPKDNVPDNVKQRLQADPDQGAGRAVHRDCCRSSPQVTDKFTLIRSMSYTPNGLFNHTAAIYQMLTGYTTDKVSPSGQLEPPTPKDFPNFGSNIVRLKPPTVPMLPFVMLPRPLQESNVVGKGGTAGFLGRAYDPYYLYPAGRRHGHGQDGPHQASTTCKLRPEVFDAAARAPGHACATLINEGMPEIDKAVAKYDLDEYYDTGAEPGHLRPGPRGVRPDQGDRRDARALRPQHVRPELPAGPPAGRGRHARRRSRSGRRSPTATTTRGTCTSACPSG